MVAPSAFAAVFDRLDGLPLSVAARELARAGVPVFPCVPGGKRPRVEHGFREATAWSVFYILVAIGFGVWFAMTYGGDFGTQSAAFSSSLTKASAQSLASARTRPM